MSATLTLSELQTKGIAPRAHEAVAVVLTLLEGQLAGVTKNEDAAPALPSPSTICLASDGAVSCSETVAALSPIEIATLLQQILDDTRQIPPALLYAIARALRAVEAPPFESPEALLAALARFERGGRREVVSGLVARFEAAVEPQTTSVPRRERRGMPTLVTHLRHELRAADRRAYEQQPANPGAMATPPSGLRRETPTMVAQLRHELRAADQRAYEQHVARVAATPARSALRRFEPVAIAVCFAAGLACFAVGDAIDIPVAPTAMRPAALASTSPAPPSIVEHVSPPASSFKTSQPPAASRRRVSRTAATRSAKPSRLRAALRFEWFRHLVAGRHDL